MAETRKTLIKLSDVKMHFPLKKTKFFQKEKSYVKAVDGVTVDIYEGETFGLVGESGCGKTTLGRIALQLYKQTAGSVIYNGTDLSSLSKEEMRLLRRELQVIFQDPYSSLNLRFTVGNIISEALVAHKMYKGGSKELEEYTLDVMEKCGLQNYFLHRYPHQFSGGQRQRIGIARALALKPRFVVCDEPVSALDVSIQSQIVNMLEDMQAEFKLTYLFIAHDISVVRHISNRMGVMYLGKLIELAQSDEIYKNPLHPYTKTLIAAVPTPDPKRNRMMTRITLEGDIPSPINPPSGCRFRTRCPFAEMRCAEAEPEFKDHGQGHFAACHII